MCSHTHRYRSLTVDFEKNKKRIVIDASHQIFSLLTRTPSSKRFAMSQRRKLDIHLSIGMYL